MKVCSFKRTRKKKGAGGEEDIRTAGCGKALTVDPTTKKKRSKRKSYHGNIRIFSARHLVDLRGGKKRGQ